MAPLEHEGRTGIAAAVPVHTAVCHPMAHRGIHLLGITPDTEDTQYHGWMMPSRCSLLQHDTGWLLLAQWSEQSTAKPVCAEQLSGARGTMAHGS